jgi:hypothetical protein
VTACFFAPFSDKPCEGRLDRCHLVSRSRLRRETRGQDPELVDRLLWHPALWVWGCRRHHQAFDGRMLRLRRGDLPAGLEGAAETLGLSWSLTADYGPVEGAA